MGLSSGCEIRPLEEILLHKKLWACFFADSLTKKEAVVLNEVPLHLVFPAKAGIQGLQGRSGCRADPASRGRR